MEIYGGILSFVLGAVVGSFLNVVILRGNVGSKSKKRSMCLSCGETLKAVELVPIFSFIWLFGRCRHCKSKISFQYPLVEISTGILFVLSFWHSYQLQPTGFALLDGLSLAAIFSVLVVIFVYDIRHKIIGDFSLIILGAIAIIRIILLHLLGYQNDFLLNLLAGPLAALPFFLLWLVSRGKWMGLGDSKLMLCLGWFIGFGLWLPASILAFWLGAAVSIFLIFLRRLKDKKIGGLAILRRLPEIGIKSEIPFAPFLILAVLISFLLNFNVISAISAFFL